MTTRVLILVGTKKGAFILESTAERRAWTLRGPFCDKWPIYHMTYDAATGVLYAAGADNWYGPTVWKSADLGETWTHSSAGITYGQAGPAITKVWHLEAAHGTLYAGVDPAGLFRSADGGQTWEHVAGLRAHPRAPYGSRGTVASACIPSCCIPRPPSSSGWRCRGLGHSTRTMGARRGRCATRACAPSTCPTPCPTLASACIS